MATFARSSAEIAPSPSVSMTSKISPRSPLFVLAPNAPSLWFPHSDEQNLQIFRPFLCCCFSCCGLVSKVEDIIKYNSRDHELKKLRKIDSPTLVDIKLLQNIFELPLLIFQSKLGDDALRLFSPIYPSNHK